MLEMTVLKVNVHTGHLESCEHPSFQASLADFEWRILGCDLEKCILLTAQLIPTPVILDPIFRNIGIGDGKTYVANEPQAESRRDPFSGMDSTVNPYGIFGCLFFSRNLHKETHKM